MPTRLYIAASRNDSVSYDLCKDAFNFLVDVFSTYSAEARLESGNTTIHCDDKTTAYLRVMTPYLCIAMLIDDNTNPNLALYDYDSSLLQNAICQLLKSN